MVGVGIRNLRSASGGSSIVLQRETLLLSPSSLPFSDWKRSQKLKCKQISMEGIM